MQQSVFDSVVIGAGIIGIATAYYLKKLDPALRVALVERGQPMAFTSAQSGENYRNWWPHPVMTAFTDHSIELMEQIALNTDNHINMTRGGYALATRAAEIQQLTRELYTGYANIDASDIRFHEAGLRNNYEPPFQSTWDLSPSGVDVLLDQELINSTFPSFAKDIRCVVHIRRAGSISSQQLGQLMLEDFRAAGGQLINAVIEDITVSNGFELLTTIPNTKFRASKIVNAAGPFASSIAAMLGIELPVQNSLQQKIAFPDEHGAIPRNMPFSIDLDAQQIDWSEEERELVAADPKLARLAGAMPGAIHCRPDGGDQSTWVRLGWAFGETGEVPQLDPPSTDHFPEVVLRGAARLNPLLKQYYGRLPRNMHHYSGYYTTTEENWPLIGELSVEGAYYVGAMSGFGTMSACAAGELCAQQVLGTELPDYAQALSLERYKNEELMAEISTLSSRGIL